MCRHQTSAQQSCAEDREQPPMHEPHNDLVLSFSPKVPHTAELSHGLPLAATERGHGLPPVLWQHSSHPSSQPPAIANTAGTVEWDGDAAPHAQSHVCTVFAQSDSQDPHKSRAVVI